MKLYAVVGSNNSRKVLAVIEHLGLGVEVEYLDFFNGDLQQLPYMELNPNGKVPTLVDGEFVLWESNAINQYLCDKVANNTLFPHDPKIRADIQRWLSWELAHYNNAFGALVWEAVAKPNFLAQQSNQAVVTWATDDLKRYAAVLDQHLAARQFVVGNDITIADYAMIHIEWFKEMVPFDWSPYPHVNAYYNRMRHTAAWSATAPSGPEVIGRKPEAVASVV